MNLLRRIGGIVLFVFLLWGCNNENITGFNEIYDGDIVLGYNDQVRVSDSMIAKMVKVDDNRCPIGKTCSSTGCVDVQLEIYYGGEFHNVEITYNKSQTTCTKTYMGHQIEIFDVLPYRYNEEVINQADYRIYLRVSKISE